MFCIANNFDLIFIFIADIGTLVSWFIGCIDGILRAIYLWVGRVDWSLVLLFLLFCSP
jgi:hypothetical protein